MSLPLHIPGSSTRPRVLFVTSATWLGFSRFPRILAAAGCDIDLICPPGAAVATSRFIAHTSFNENGLSAICQELRERLKLYPQRYAWVSLGDDELFRAVGDRFTPIELASWYPIKSDPRTRLFFESKHEFHDRCQELGLTIAPYRVCQNASEAQKAKTEIGFPMVAKLLISTGGNGVIPIRTEAEFTKLASGWTYPIAFQKFVTGRAFSTETVFDRGVPVSWASSEQINRWPHAFGPSTARRTMYLPEIEHSLRVIGEYTGYHGVGSIDAILPDDGGPAVLCEMNPRPTPGYSLHQEYVQMYGASLARMLAGSPHPPHAAPFAEVRETGFFPEALYYLAEKPGEVYRWQMALGSIRNAQRDDPKLLAKMTELVVRKIMDKHRFDRALRRNMRTLCSAILTRLRTWATLRPAAQSPHVDRRRLK